VFWFNNGSRWSSMAGYVNLLGNKSKTRMEINQPVYVRHSSSGSPQPGGNYAMHYEIDYTPGNKVAWYTIKQGSNTIKSHSYNHNQSGFQTSRTFIQFGTQVAPEGPEASTYGWRFSDFTAEYEP
jgi:hypothetical protein